MTKPVITTRADKGSALTWTEGDTNLENLRDATISITDGTNTASLDLNDTLSIMPGSNITLTVDSTTKSLTINSTASGGLQSVSQDTAPTLGGTLNVNGNYITGNIDENVRILPSGVGRVNLSGLLYPNVDGTSGQVLSTDGAGNISWSNASGLTSISQDTTPTLGGNLNVNGNQITNNPYADLQITAGTGGLVSLSAEGGVRIQSIYYPGPNGASQGQYLAFDGSNTMVWTTPSSGGTSLPANAAGVLTNDGAGNLSWAAGSSGGGITSISQDTAPALGGHLDPNGYAIYSPNHHLPLTAGVGYNVMIQGSLWPSDLGTSGQVLTTDGAGNLSWSTVSSGGGITSISQDTAPALGGNLDVGTYSISDSTGNVKIGNGFYSTTLTTPGTNALTLNTNGGVDTAYITITNGQMWGNGDITLVPYGSNGTVILKGLRWPTADGSNNQFLKTDGAGNLSWGDASLGYTAENTANKGQANGYAGLDANGLVPSTQLPSYVDDVLEYANLASFPSTGETGKIYVTADTSRSYRWTGSVYSEIIASPGTTDNVTEGSTNLYFTTTRARDSFSAGTNISIVNGTINSTVTPGIASVSADTAPVLGGNLDVNGKSIVSVSNGNITIAPNGTGKTIVNNINYYETPYTLTYGATITPNVTNGNVQVVTLTGNVTFSAFTSPVAGQSLTLIVKQDATGSRTLTSTMKFAGGTKTLSTAANSTDIITVFYDGTTYWASLGKDFK